MKTVFISPFVNDTNDYIIRVRAVLEDAGFQVKPFSFRSLAFSEVGGLFDPNNYVLVHWLESRVFTEGRGRSRVRLAGLLQFCAYVLVMLVMRARLVYFVHDHAVHDLSGWRRTLSMRLIGLLRRMSDLRVVHDPSFAQQYGAVYLPHPLYDERPEGRASQRPQEGFRAGVLGAVRPYKRIEDLIAVWPEGPTLVIRGRADAAYETDLRKAIAAREAGVLVDMKTGFMSREAFVAEMGRLDALILPHADASMLVSGAFFEAIGSVPFIIARETPFTRWASEQFSGVLTFRTEAELLVQVRRAWHARDGAQAELAAAGRKANAMFGHAACVRLYGAILHGAALRSVEQGGR